MLKELFEKNKNIVINTDIDGILSGIILVKSLGCKIVGFTYSKEYVWLADEHNDLYSNVYVDMFVTDNRAICIDQHIVAVSNEHQEKIKATGTKYSPQIDGNRIFTNDSYPIKYPFGATHYIIAQLESEGIKVELPDLMTPVPNSKINLADLILRADDAMASTVYAYRDNALNWWDYLKKKSPESVIINGLMTYLEEMREEILDDMIKSETRNNKKNRDEACKKVIDKIKIDTKEYFHNEFGSKCGDGGFRKITNDQGNLLPNIKKYIKAVATTLGLADIDIPEHYIIHKGIYHRSSWLPYFEKDLVKDYTFYGHKIFSYAFIYTPDETGKINFSFTLDME